MLVLPPMLSTELCMCVEFLNAGWLIKRRIMANKNILSDYVCLYTEKFSEEKNKAVCDQIDELIVLSDKQVEKLIALGETIAIKDLVKILTGKQRAIMQNIMLIELLGWIEGVN